MDARMYEAWHKWMWQCWRAGIGFWCGGYALWDHVEYGDYNGFAAGTDE